MLQEDGAVAAFREELVLELSTNLCFSSILVAFLGLLGAFSGLLGLLGPTTTTEYLFQLRRNL